MTKTSVLAGLMLLTVAGLCLAEDERDWEKENAELRERVEKLEKTVQTLTEKAPAVDQKKGKPTQPAQGEKSRKPVWSSLDIQLYGYIKGDASYDNSRTHPGTYVVWVNSEATNKNDDEVNLTANQTRLGMRINGPDGSKTKTSGRVEIDFYGSGAPENKAKIQMRHAYMEMAWSGCGLSVLAGQTSDVVSPLAPSTLNYTVLWDAGNIGYRRPQIRVTKDVPLSDQTSLQFQGALARTIGRASAFTGSETGEDAGFPTVQARAAVKFPGIDSRPTVLGISGHRGREEYDIAATGANKDFDTWSMNLDLTAPICDKVTFKGELFTGENLNEYFGGIGQGVRPIMDGTGKIINHANSIAAKGGWFAFALGPWDSWRFNVGAGIDDVEPADLNAGDRTLNRAVFGNALYAINKHASVGVELSHWRTDYLGGGPADTVRAQLSFIYSF